jgi:hypothetical protein
VRAMRLSCMMPAHGARLDYIYTLAKYVSERAAVVQALLLRIIVFFVVGCHSRDLDDG